MSSTPTLGRLPTELWRACSLTWIFGPADRVGFVGGCHAGDQRRTGDRTIAPACLHNVLLLRGFSTSRSCSHGHRPGANQLAGDDVPSLGGRLPPKYPVAPRCSHGARGISQGQRGSNGGVIDGRIPNAPHPAAEPEILITPGSLLGGAGRPDSVVSLDSQHRPKVGSYRQGMQHPSPRSCQRAGKTSQ